MKNFQVDPNHPLFALSPHVATFVDEFLRGKDLSYFFFGRYYQDGSFLPLISRGEVIKEIFNHGYGSASSFKDEDKSKASYAFMWDEELPEDLVSVLRTKCHIFQGMTIIRRSRNHYDMICFGKGEEGHNPGGFYLSRIKAIDEFANSFEDAFKSIIKNPTPYLFLPPPPQQDVNCLEICMGNKPISIQGREGTSHLTSREAECLQLLARNLSYKEIATYLDISPRTVETLFERSRNRTGLTLQQLVRQLTICP